jgi:hypothetical protein
MLQLFHLSVLFDLFPQLRNLCPLLLVTLLCLNKKWVGTKGRKEEV